MYPYNSYEMTSPIYSNHYLNEYNQYYDQNNYHNDAYLRENQFNFLQDEEFVSGRLSYMPLADSGNGLLNQYRDQQYPIPIGIVFMMPDEQRPVYLITKPEVERLKGKRIRTTLPNITGTVTATVGEYNSQTNRVMLLNIVSDRNGVSYGNLAYLLDEVGGLQEIEGVGPDGPDGPPPGQDCTKTGGPGKRIDAGTVTYAGVPIGYTINECEVVVNVFGIRYVLTRGHNSAGVNYPINPLNRYRGSIYIQNKTLWVELELQTKNPLTGSWHKTVGGKTKLGSWQSLKF